MKDKSIKQHRNYVALRVCTAIDRFLTSGSDEEREQANKWVRAWKKRLAMLNKSNVVPMSNGARLG